MVSDTESLVRQYSNIITDPVRRADYEAFLVHIVDYTEINRRLNSLMGQGDAAAASAVFANSQDAFDEMLYHLGRIRNDEAAIARSASARATTTAASMRSFFIWLTVGAIAGLIGLGFYIWYSLTSGLRRLQVATRRVTSGDLSQLVSVKSKDEFGELAESFNNMLSSLKQSMEENQRLTQEALKLKEERIGLLQQQFSTIIRAQEEERKRIARELHDDTAQQLVTLSRGLDSITSRHSSLPESTAARLEELRQVVDSCLQSIRRYSQDLRPSIIDDLGLVPALDWLADRMERFDSVRPRITVKGERRRLSPETELALFRIAQEALNNVVKHAQATQVDIHLSFQPHKVTMSVTDNGRGFILPSWKDAVARGQLGLLGMRERAQLVNGNVQVSSDPGKGTSILLEVPLNGT